MLDRNRQPTPTPVTRLWASMNCQFSVLVLVIMMVKVVRKVLITRTVRSSASTHGPKNSPVERSRDAYVEPIYEIFDAGMVARRVIV